MFSSFFSFLIIAGLLLTGQTTTVGAPVTPTARTQAPVVTQSEPDPTIEASRLEFKEMSEEEPANGESPWIATGLSSENIVSAKTEKSEFGIYYVLITFDAAGKRLFTEVTTRNIGRQVGIFVDGTLISAPTVNEAITGGTAQITGNFTYEEAKLLADKINAGIK
jgi:preprotein translocase subunit SecD